jgi:glycosyltransferase involved in cell wall biosynthesis
MIFSIIINTHNQHKTIIKCIKSCLNQNFNKKYEIIIADTSDKNLENKIKLIKSKKIIYKHYNKNFSNIPEINQIKKIYSASKIAKGKWFCLLDGDDYFKKNKLKYIYNNINLKKNIIIQDKINNNNNLYKYNYIYKKLINLWPEIYGTSCLSGSMSFLKKFFQSTNLDRWNMLAIDALLVLYSTRKKKIHNLNKILTIKNITRNSVSYQYNLYSKKYWLRRSQQLKYWENINKKKIYNLDKIICELFYFFYSYKFIMISTANTYLFFN